jgi:hypothetical protein
MFLSALHVYRDGPLSELVLLTRPRLSVQEVVYLVLLIIKTSSKSGLMWCSQVREADWNFILGLENDSEAVVSNP